MTNSNPMYAMNFCFAISCCRTPFFVVFRPIYFLIASKKTGLETCEICPPFLTANRGVSSCLSSIRGCYSDLSTILCSLHCGLYDLLLCYIDKKCLRLHCPSRCLHFLLFHDLMFYAKHFVFIICVIFGVAVISPQYECHFLTFVLWVQTFPFFEYECRNSVS